MPVSILVAWRWFLVFSVVWCCTEEFAKETRNPIAYSECFTLRRFFRREFWKCARVTFEMEEVVTLGEKYFNPRLKINNCKWFS